MMKRMVWVLVWSVAGGVSAQEPLTLDGAVAAALARHPSVALPGAGLARAQAGVREVGATLLPAITLEANVTRFQEPMVVAPLHGFDARNPPTFDELLAQGSLNVGYTLLDGGARRAHAVRAGALADAARHALESARQALVVEVTRSYTAVLLARELAAAHGARVAALEVERSRASRLLEQGKAARVLVLRADAALSAARAEHAAAEMQVENTEHELARWLDVEAATVHGTALVNVRARGPLVERDSALAHALRANPELARAAAQVEAARAGGTEAQAQWWPRLHLGGRYVRYGSGAGDAGGEWQTGMQLSYTVWNGGARPAASDRARADVHAAEAERALARQRIAALVDAAWTRVRMAQARAAAWSAAVAQYGEVVRIEKLALDAGAGVQADYLTAEAELLRARAAAAEARYGELVAHAELARAMGVLSPEWLARNVERVS